MAKVSTGAAAAALGKNRKTLQRWAKKPGCPLGVDGMADVGELRAWAEAAGLLERTQESGPRTGVERALAEAEPVAAAPAVAKAKATLEQLDVKGEGAKLLLAIEADDRAALLKEGLGAQPALLKKIEALGKARAALADAVKRELDNQVRRRELLQAADVVRAWTGQVEVVKAAFEAMPGKLATRLVQQDYDTVYAALEGELRALLESFAVKELVA